MINVLIVDDQNLTHKLIETYLKPKSEINIVGFASNGQEAIAKIPLLQPNVILMDVEMPEMDGLSATKIITQQFPQSKVLIFTVHDNEDNLSQALENGAKGYLLKTTTAKELTNAISYVNQGYFHLSVELTEKYLQKIIITKSKVEEVAETDRKVNYLYRALGKIENHLQQSSSGNLERHLELKIKDILEQEMLQLRDRDSNLQFKVDRMKHSQERLEKSVSSLFRVQIALIVVTLLFAAYIVFNRLN